MPLLNAIFRNLVSSAIFLAQRWKSTLFLAFIALIAFDAVREIYWRDVAYIEPLHLPEALEDYGYSAEVGAYRLRDALVSIADTATDLEAFSSTDSPEAAVFLPITEELSFEIPRLEWSFRSTVLLARRFLRVHELRIAGEFVCPPDGGERPCSSRETIQMRLRIFKPDGSMKLIEMPAIGQQDLTNYFLRAALGVLDEIDPYTVARYALALSLDARNPEDPAPAEVPTAPDNDRDAESAGLSIAEGMDADSLLAQAERVARKVAHPSHEHYAYGLEMLGLIAYRRTLLTDEEEADIQLYGDADLWFRRAIEEASDLQKRQIYNSWGFVTRRNSLLEDTERTKLAIRRYDMAIHHGARHSRVFNNRGFANRRVGNNAAAERDYTRAIALDPDYFQAYNNRGAVRRRLCKFEEAASDYQRATELKPDYRVAYANLGYLLSRWQRYDEAEAAYRKAVAAITPETRKRTQATTYLNWGVHAYRHSRKLRTDNEESKAELRLAEAEDRLNEALARRPGYDRANYYLGLIAETRGDLERAEQRLKAAISDEVHDSDDRRQLAEVHEALARVQEQSGATDAARKSRAEARRLRADVKIGRRC